MKIIFCGPPHSGKSVFIANLIEKMPTDAYTIIRACPDGEGTWSNNKNQSEINIVRKKGTITKTFVDNSCRAIDNQTNKIVLVDVGGVISPENEQIFHHCDSFVILSNDDKQKKKWLKFGQGLGLECVGCLDSSLEGQEEIYSRTPYFQGKIVGLERGEILENSFVINAIASDIIKKSKYSEKIVTEKNNFSDILIDDTELGFELGYGKEIFTEDGTPIKKVKWSENAIPKIYTSVCEKINPNYPLRINGVRANFALCAICKAAKQQGVTDIYTYDIRLKQYIPIRTLPKKKGLQQSDGLLYNIIENNENIFMDIDITNEQYSLDAYQRCTLQQINEGKNLYISGRLPLWLLASISSSYNSSKIFTFQPGKGFTCISSIDERDLGTIVDGVNGIDVNQYFEDKKVKDKTKLPQPYNKQNPLSKIKAWLSNINATRKNSKYINNTIKANIVPQKEPALSKFQSNLKEEVPENSNLFGQAIPKNESERETSQYNIGK